VIRVGAPRALAASSCISPRLGSLSRPLGLGLGATGLARPDIRWTRPLILVPPSSPPRLYPKRCVVRKLGGKFFLAGRCRACRNRRTTSGCSAAFHRVNEIRDAAGLLSDTDFERVLTSSLRALVCTGAHFFCLAPGHRRSSAEKLSCARVAGVARYALRGLLTFACCRTIGPNFGGWGSDRCAIFESGAWRRSLELWVFGGG